MRFLIVLFYFLLPVSSYADDVQVYFSPSVRCENTLIERIEDSKEKIDAAVYAINNDDIVKALKKAFDRGVKLRILTDRLQASNKSSKVKELKEYGVNVRVHSRYKIEHNKFAVFDGERGMTGSYNWTEPATKKNSENCMFFEDEKAVKEYQERFNYLWQMNTKRKSDEWFERNL